MIKLCYGCNEIMDINNFHKDKKAKDGFKTKCKVCRNNMMKIYSSSEARKLIRSNNINFLYKNDKLFKLKHGIKTLIQLSFKRKGYKKYSKTHNILGCTVEEFKKYIEGKFVNDMSWDNHGTYWDIDHIIPISSATSEADIIKLNHYTNLQPLDSYINRYVKKGRLDYYDNFNKFY